MATQIRGSRQVKPATITETELSASVAGDGLTGGAGTALAINLTAAGGLQIVTDALGVKLDGTTLSLSASGLKASAIPYTVISSVPTATVLGRNTAGTGAAEALGTLPTAVQDAITRLGTIAVGVWQGTKIGLAYGGTNLSTVASGGLLYASALDTLSVRTIGSAADVLTVSGGFPTWAPPAAAATSVIADDTTTNATMYPTWVTAATGSLPLKVSSTKLSWNPSLGRMTLSDNAAALPAPAPTGVLLHVGQVDGTASRVLVDAFGGNPIYMARRANTSAASPSALTAGDFVFAFAGFGYGTTAYSSAARLSIVSAATETWTDTKQGTNLQFSVTTTGTTTLVEAMRLTTTAVLIGTTTEPGAGSGGLVFGDGTALSSMASNTAGLYGDDVNGTVNLFAINEAGDLTNLSGHSGRAAAQVAAVASVVALTVGAADGSFEVVGNILVTTATTHSFTMTCAYTDEGNTARTVTLNFSTVAGVISNAAITNVAGAVPYEGVPIRIRAKASTTITLATTGTFTTVTYNVEGLIRQVK